MDFNVCKKKGFNYAVKGKKKGAVIARDIPAYPEQETFSVESSEEIVEIWVDDPDVPGNTPWAFRYKPTSPQSVNVTIGGDE